MFISLKKKEKTTILALVAPVLGGVVCHLRDHDLLQLTHALHHRAPAPGKKNQLYRNLAQCSSPDPDPDFLLTPDPGIKKAPDPGSGSATLIASSLTRHHRRWRVRSWTAPSSRRPSSSRSSSASGRRTLPSPGLHKTENKK